ncbi:MAG: SAM-dependent methyltransferase [Nocardioides sp.]|nr:SAM-dependent methyltransferase [Nocardioides sp.]
MSAHRLAEQRALWDAEAAAYDDEPDHGLRDPATREAWRQLLAAHLPAAPARVTELGCGTATLSLLVAEAGHHVRGVDLSPQMLGRGLAKVAASGLPVELAEGDAGDPPYAAGSADVVLCRHVLWALPDPGTALERWRGLLTEDGRMVLVEGHWHTGGGLTADATCALLREHVPDLDVRVVPLTDDVYWGGPISDERYLVVAAPA